MESFFDFIISNPFIAIIIISALIGLFNKKKREEKSSTSPQVEKMGNSEAKSVQRTERVKNTEQTIEKSIQNINQSMETSYEEKRQEQYEQLKKQYQFMNEQNRNDITNIPKPIKHSELKSHIHINFDNKLTPNGLIESVMMAEVLGPPRAQKPYENIIMRRK